MRVYCMFAVLLVVYVVRVSDVCVLHERVLCIVYVLSVCVSV